MKKHPILIALLVLLIIVIGIWGVRTFIDNQNDSGASAASHCDSKHIPGVTLDAARGQGLPAIKRHLCSIPTFNEKDVRHYMSGITKFNGMRIEQTSAHYTITRVLFVSNQTANDTLNADTGVTDNALIVCYVEVHGDFTVGVPMSSKDNKPLLFHRGRIVFDGVSGNMLLMGVMP